MQYRSLGPDLPAASIVSLGSWNTFSRLSFEENLALIRAALDGGVNLFDIGYYWDKPDTEAIFTRAVRTLGLGAGDYIHAQKLWLWDYPKQSFADQLKESLQRLGRDDVDIVMVSRPLPDLELHAFLDEIGALVGAGLCRAWGITNWEPDLIATARTYLADQGLPAPRMVQLQYNVARRSLVETPAYEALFSDGLGLCAANVLEGGILAGHLDRDRVHPSQFADGVRPVERNICRDSGGIRERIRESQTRLTEIAAGMGLTAAQAALGAVLANPSLTTALLGVTRLSDLADNLAVVERPDWSSILEAVDDLKIEEVAHPRLFSPTEENA